MSICHDARRRSSNRICGTSTCTSGSIGVPPVQIGDAAHRAVAHVCRLGAIALALLVAVAGCSESEFDLKLDRTVQDIFAPRKSPEAYMMVAVSSEDADLRRDAVTRVSRSKDYNKEWAIKGCYAIACLENDPQTRCAAIRALARSGDPRATEAMLKILNHADYPEEEVVPPTELVRWDATHALADLTEHRKIPDESKADVERTLIDRLRLDEERHARMAGARGLSGYPSVDALSALIAGLRDQDFAVAHACETSLVTLTGVTHGLDAAAWEKWLEDNADAAFASAGSIPESRRPKYSNAVEKAAYDTKDLVEYLWPGEAK